MIDASPTPLRQAVRPTTFLDAPRLSESLGMDLTIATEGFQHTGSFKFRAAYNLVLHSPQPIVLTASSGNFGQALAYACRLLGKRAIVVMPKTSAQVKIDAVRSYGGEVDLVDVSTTSRAERVAQIAAEHPQARVASAYDDPHVIAGNASLGHELAESGREFDMVVAPVGGGGLTAGLVQGLCEAGHRAKVIGAEPLLANDGARSLRQGEIVANEREPMTIADGARTVSLGRLNFEILRAGLGGIVEVPEERIVEALRALFLLANLKVEPTGALAIGAILTDPERFRGRRVMAVVSGANVDPGTYAGLLNGEPPR